MQASNIAMNCSTATQGAVDDGKPADQGDEEPPIRVPIVQVHMANRRATATPDR